MNGYGFISREYMNGAGSTFSKFQRCHHTQFWLKFPPPFSWQAYCIKNLHRGQAELISTLSTTLQCDCCLKQVSNFSAMSWRALVTYKPDDCTGPTSWFYFFNAISLKQQSIQVDMSLHSYTLSWLHVLTLTPEGCVLIGEAAHVSFIVFGLTLQGLNLWPKHEPLHHWRESSSKQYNIRVMVFKATFNNISVISWGSVLLMEESRAPRENKPMRVLDSF